MSFFKRVKSSLQGRLRKALCRNRFENSFLPSLPREFHSAARYVYDRDATESELAIGKRIEAFRSEIESIEGDLHSFNSPRSGTFKTQNQGHAVAGEYVTNSASAHSRTGSSIPNGILLQRIVTGLAAKTVLELGANTGLSGCYFIGLPEFAQLITVEGSEDLCKIADKNMSRISNNYRLMHALFDDAIDELIGEGVKVDSVFIDGQHEREATWHYTQRVMPLLSPGSSIIYDDIYWSADMNQMWKEVAASPDFSTTVDLRTKGIAVLKSGDETKRHFDICTYLGRPSYYRKRW